MFCLNSQNPPKFSLLSGKKTSKYSHLKDWNLWIWDIFLEKVFNNYSIIKNNAQQISSNPLILGQPKLWGGRFACHTHTHTVELTQIFVFIWSSMMCIFTSFYLLRSNMFQPQESDGCVSNNSRLIQALSEITFCDSFAAAAKQAYCSDSTYWNIKT